MDLLKFGLKMGILALGVDGLDTAIDAALADGVIDSAEALGIGGRAVLVAHGAVAAGSDDTGAGVHDGAKTQEPISTAVNNTTGRCSDPNRTSCFEVGDVVKAEEDLIWIGGHKVQRGAVGTQKKLGDRATGDWLIVDWWGGTGEQYTRSENLSKCDWNELWLVISR